MKYTLPVGGIADIYFKLYEYLVVNQNLKIIFTFSAENFYFIGPLLNTELPYNCDIMEIKENTSAL